MQVGNTHINVNNPENSQKTGRISFTSKCKEATMKKVGRLEMQLGTKGTCETAGERDSTDTEREERLLREPTWGRQIPITFSFEDQRGQIS